MSGHTSGMFAAIEDFGDQVVIKPCPSALNGRYYIATCHDYPEDGTAAGNARLLAAAPEMLAALNEVSSALALIAPNNFRLRAVVVAAIAKARGEAA